MQEYLQHREKTRRRSRLAGILATVLAHLCVLTLVSFTGLKYLYPPPPESTFLIDFTEEPEPEIIDREKGLEPEGDRIDPEKEAEIVQKSESPEVSEAPNLTPAAKPDTHGDVEVTEPERKEEPVIDPRASFPGMAKKDTSITTPHSAADPRATFKEGQPDGNSEQALASGKANAQVEGRKHIGMLPLPGSRTNQAGKIVVKILVDQYGNVTNADVPAEGTTISDTKLWNDARNAALKAKFDTKADAPVKQQGTITYVFILQ